ncbi:MAG TPA: hypothetical protein VGJ32_11130 [Solirubrobacteraceae bacterium]
MPGLSDVSQTLDALERKLRDLESGLGVAPAPRAAPAPTSGGGGLDELARQIDDLGRFREQLERVGRELEQEYARVLARLGDAGARDAPAPAPEPPAAAPPAPEPPPGPPPVAPPEPVVLDAGPFADLAALGAFEQAVSGIGGVAAVDVTGFEGRRALVEVRLSAPVALAAELRLALPDASVREGSAPDRLVLDLEAPA